MTRRLPLLARLLRSLTSRRRHPRMGFTLIELLVSLFIATIISLALLSFVVDMTRTNQQDTARTETQRDIQLAMNYISQELREAVFVYDGQCLKGAGTITNLDDFPSSCPGIVNHIPAGLSATTAGVGTSIPVLAFWRADMLPPAVQTKCRAAYTNSAGSGIPTGFKDFPCIQGRTYTLVVYVLVDRAANATDIWNGKARLVRYQLSQFRNQDELNSQYYFDPQKTSFQQWPYTIEGGAVTNKQLQRPPETTLNAVIASGNAQVLVDFMDDWQNPTGAPARTAVTPACPDLATAAQPAAVTPLGTTIRSMYACVRGKTYQTKDQTDAPLAESQQEVVLTMTGNVEGRAGFANNIPVGVGATEFNQRYRDRFLFTQQTRVLVRGSRDKNPGT